MKKIMAGFLVFTLLVGCCSCGTQQTKPALNTDLDTSESVALTICGVRSSCRAFETAAEAFHTLYPNCTVTYEYVQNYDEMLKKRLEESPESVDLFMHNNIQADSDILPYTLDLMTQDALDLSGTNEALIRNYTLKSTVGTDAPQLYAIPLGGEVRGLYVNQTLLQSLGLETPRNSIELLAACETLKKAGYVPMQGNPGAFAQWLLYPYICNLIAHAPDYDATFDQVNTCASGVSELFRDPIALLYQMTENHYYDYKFVETELNMFTDLSNEAMARNFFHVVEDGADFKKVDDLGLVPFMAGTLTQKAMMDQTRADYHSTIEYTFIMAPVSEEGGYAYISPATGIAVNKNSAHADWAVEFLNYLFSAECSTRFAAEMNYLPNSDNSFAIAQEEFDLPNERITDVGQVTFGYDFYSLITQQLVTVAKSNNPKYMDTDAAGNAVMFPLDYYMQQIEAAFAAQREAGGA